MNSTHMIDKPNVDHLREEASLKSEYGIRITPQRKGKRDSSRLNKSKSKTEVRPSNSTQKQLRSRSGRKRSNL
jgi:hypothetical protein